MMTNTAPQGPAEGRARSDAAQREAIVTGGPLFVVGGPGSGKTTVARARARYLLTGQGPRGAQAPGRTPNPDVVMWCKNRHDSSATRDWLVRVTGLALSRPVALTPHSWAYAVLRRHAAHTEQVAPVLISGPEQDARLGELLAGHRLGEGRATQWPVELDSAVQCLGFRSELRELLGRCAELDVSPEQLAQWGRDFDRPEWVAAGEVFAEYMETTALSGVPAFDQGALLTSAEKVLQQCSECAQVAASMQDLVVDDAQELTAAAVRLVKWLAAAGVSVCLLGDSDVATLGFRGADPGGWFESSAWLPPQAQRRVVVLGSSWRMAPEVSALYSSLVQRLGVSAGAQHRTQQPVSRPAEANRRPAQVSTYAAPSARHEMAYVAAMMRRAVRRGASWSDLAVVVRAGTSLSGVRRHLVAQGIPVAAAVDHTPMRSQPSVHVLRALSSLVLTPEAVTPSQVMQVLMTVPDSFDSWRQHHAVERAREWLAERPDLTVGAAVADEAPLEEAEVLRLAVLHADESPEAAALAPVRQVADVVRIGRAAHKAADGQADRVLWAIWNCTGLSDRWRDQALHGGRHGARADEHLDAVMALFDAAGRFVQGRHGASLAGFWQHVDQLTLASDTLAARGNPTPGVSLLTPAAAAGKQFHTVVVWGVHEGLWPNPTLRDTLLGGGALSDVAHGRTDGVRAGDRDWMAARASVFADELRMFLVACTRATHDVIVTCVEDEETSASEFFAAVQRHATRVRGETDSAAAVMLETPGPSLLVARCRQRATELVSAVPRLDDDACAVIAAGCPAVTEDARAEYDVVVRQLVRLAAARIPGAHPSSWALPPTSGPWQRIPPGELVPLSPSAIETALTCPLRWFLRTVGLGGSFTLASQLGTLVHAIAAAHPQGTADELLAELDRRWPELGLPNAWWAFAERRRVQDMLTKWAGHVARNRRDLVGVEIPFRAQVGAARLRGQIDRLERDADGRLVVVDLKTGRVAPTKKDVATNPQLAMYQLGIRHAAAGHDVAGEPGGGELVLIGTDTKSAAIREQAALGDMDDQAWPEHLVVQATKIAAGGSFAAQPGDDCDRCEFAHACPARAASLMYPDGVLPTLVGEE